MFFGILVLSDWGTIATIASAIISFVLAILTFNNVRLTKQTVEEMKTAREESVRPFIVAGYNVDEKRIVHFYVENLGGTPATNIEVITKKPIIIENGIDVQKKVFDKPVKYLAPKEKIDTVLFTTWEIPEGNEEYAENSVEVKYFDSIGVKSYTEKYDIGIKPFVESLYLTEFTMNDLVKEMKELNRTLKSN